MSEHEIVYVSELGYSRPVCKCGGSSNWPCPDVAQAYDRVVFVQGHRHAEPICCEPSCETYLTLIEMANLPDVSATPLAPLTTNETREDT